MVGQRSLQENQEQLQEDQEQMQKEYVPLLEKDLRQRRKIWRHESEKARQKSNVPKRQHCGRHKEDKRRDHNTGTPFEFHHSQENKKALTEAQVCSTHVAEEERNKQNEEAKVVIVWR